MICTYMYFKSQTMKRNLYLCVYLWSRLNVCDEFLYKMIRKDGGCVFNQFMGEFHGKNKTLLARFCRSSEMFET